MKNKFKYLSMLFNEKNVLEKDTKIEEIFFFALKEVFTHHYNNCIVYRKLCNQENFYPDSLNNPEDISKIPWIMVNVFKKYHLTSVPDDKIVKTFTSSGTTGEKSHISWDKESFERQKTMRNKIMENYGLITSTKVNYLCFTYSPDIAGDRGAPYAHTMYTNFAPANRKFFAIHSDWEGKEFFDPAECTEILKEFSKTNLPLRIIGFPAFAWKTLQYLAQKNIKFNFSNKDSLIIFAGGWKAMADEEIPKSKFYNYVEKYLGISRTQIRDVYGFVEHGVPYITCEFGNFHVPIYSKVFVRKPGSLKLLTYGEKGMLHMISPYNIAQPNISVLSTDYGIIEKNCKCGRNSDYIILVGRAGIKKHQGCAITAAELLKVKKI